MNIRKATAFIKRDLYWELSYRFSFAWEILGIFFSVTMFYFIAKLFGPSALPYLEGYQVDYFPFVLLGIAFQTYFTTALSAFSGAIAHGQITGTLEAMLVTPTKLVHILVYSSLWRFLEASRDVLVYLLLGVLLFQVNFGNVNLLSAGVILALTILSFSCVGILSASFILVFKRGDPIAFVMGTLSALLGGVYYPITVLPDWLQTFSYFIPLTYSLRGMRHAVLQGYSVSQLLPDILPLLAFFVAMLPVSSYGLRYAIRRAKAGGTLAHY